MAYENLELSVAKADGQIYLSKINSKNQIAGKRRLYTEECLSTAMEWFMAYGEELVYLKDFNGSEEGKEPCLIYTDNPEQRQKILAYLRGEGTLDGQ